MASNDRISSLYLNTSDFNELNDCSNESQIKEKCIKCLICEDVVNEERSESIATQLQTHLLTKHHLLIADIELISDLNKYCDYWRLKLNKCQDLSQFCAVINTNRGSEDIQPSETYFMIGGNEQQFPEDSQLRKRIKESNLESILLQSQLERNDELFSRNCIFCRKVFTGNRLQLFDHLTTDHNLSVGHPDNIVNCKQLLDLLEEKLSKLECLYCEKTFKSWQILKEHMRKKGHKLLNPNNRDYDKFYLINYLSPEKHWQEVKLESDKYEDTTCDENEWDDWCEDEDKQNRCICLFCHYCSQFNQLKHHLLSIHKFDFNSIILKLDFYLRIKLINYIRRCIHEKRCHKCEQTFANCDDLIVHLDFSGHIMETPDKSEYDLPEYFFSTYENDNLLHFLDNEDDDQQENEEIIQIDSINKAIEPTIE